MEVGPGRREQRRGRGGGGEHYLAASEPLQPSNLNPRRSPNLALTAGPTCTPSEAYGKRSELPTRPAPPAPPPRPGPRLEEGKRLGTQKVKAGQWGGDLMQGSREDLRGGEGSAHGPLARTKGSSLQSGPKGLGTLNTPEQNHPQTPRLAFSSGRTPPLGAAAHPLPNRACFTRPTPKDIKVSYSCYSYSRFRFGRGWGSGDWS